MKANKILVTGSAGFIGSHLTEFLITNGFQVKAFIHYNSNNSRGWLENSEFLKEIEFYAGDIRDYDSVSNAAKDCSVIFHLAALIGIPYSYVSPKAYIDTNIIGTYNVLQIAKEKSIDQVLITSTSETYGTAQYVPIDENHPLVGQSPYSASKIGADQLALSYFKSFGIPLKIVRPFNTFGPRQSSRAVIPTIITQMISGTDEIKLGNTDITRDFTFVKDTCNGFLEIYKSEKLFGEVVNIGMGSEISIRDIKELIASLLGKDKTISIDKDRVRPVKSEVERLLCDNSRLLNNTNWKPFYNIETALLETINWIKANLNYYKIGQYTI